MGSSSIHRLPTATDPHRARPHEAHRARAKSPVVRARERSDRGRPVAAPEAEGARSVAVAERVLRPRPGTKTPAAASFRPLEGKLPLPEDGVAPSRTTARGATPGRKV